MAPTNSLAGVEIFLRVVKAGSFTAAASQLGLSKSGIAKSVSQLETRLGVRLLHRTTRRLSLTPEGALYFERSDAAVEQLREAEDLARSRATTLRGVLRVDMPASYGRRVALPVLLDILKAHPELRLDASFSDRVIDPVEEGVDLCIRFGSLPDRADLAARRLGEQRLIICAAPEYLRATSVPESVAELDAHASVVGSRGGRPNRWLLTDGNGSTFTYEPSATHLCSDGDAVIAMTLAGFGLCQMPESLLLPHIRDGSLTRVLDKGTYAQSTCHAVWPIVRQMLPRVRVVVDELVRRGRAGEL